MEISEENREKLLAHRNKIMTAFACLSETGEINVSSMHELECFAYFMDEVFNFCPSTLRISCDYVIKESPRAFNYQAEDSKAES